MKSLKNSYEGHTYIVANNVDDAERKFSEGESNDDFDDAMESVQRTNGYHRIMGDPERVQLYEVELKIYPIE